jgi:hypothetical protein
MCLVHPPSCQPIVREHLQGIEEEVMRFFFHVLHSPRGENADLPVSHVVGRDGRHIAHVGASTHSAINRPIALIMGLVLEIHSGSLKRGLVP